MPSPLSLLRLPSIKYATTKCVLVLRLWRFWLFEFFVLSLVNQLSGLTVKWFTDIQNVPGIVSFGSNKDICSLNLGRSSTSAASHGIFDGDGMNPKISDCLGCVSVSRSFDADD